MFRQSCTRLRCRESVARSPPTRKVGVMNIRSRGGISWRAGIAVELIAAMLALSCTSSPSSPDDPPARVSAPSVAPSFVEFESGQVRPLAMSPDKQYLFAVNTPDNRLE